MLMLHSPVTAMSLHGQNEIISCLQAELHKSQHNLKSSLTELEQQELRRAELARDRWKVDN